VDMGSEVLMYHEASRADGAHELRLAVTDHAWWAAFARGAAS
jgi:hypothetical protein